MRFSLVTSAHPHAPAPEGLGDANPAPARLPTFNPRSRGELNRALEKDLSWPSFNRRRRGVLDPRGVLPVAAGKRIRRAGSQESRKNGQNPDVACEFRVARELLLTLLFSRLSLLSLRFVVFLGSCLPGFPSEFSTLFSSSATSALSAASLLSLLRRKPGTLRAPHRSAPAAAAARRSMRPALRADAGRTEKKRLRSAFGRRPGALWVGRGLGGRATRQGVWVGSVEVTARRRRARPPSGRSPR